MSSSLYLLYPLSSAILYAFAAIFLKQLLQKGILPLHLTIFANLAASLLYAPLLFFAKEPIPTHLLYQPFIAGVLFLFGQLVTFLALRLGDVSVATPLLGSKVLFVTVLTFILLRSDVPLTWWIGACLAVAALFFLRAGDGTERKNFWPTVLLSLLSSVLFASGDVLIQKWSGAWEFTSFLPFMFFSVGIMSVGLLFLPISRGFATLFRNGNIMVFVVALLLALQALGMGYAILRFGKAAPINIAYSSRGLWTVVLIWLFGPYLGNHERSIGMYRMAGRITGSILILGAIALVIS